MPRLTGVPAGGLVASTGASAGPLVPPRARPSDSRVALAWSAVWPFRSGSGTVSGPFDTTTCTTEPRGTCVPGGGFRAIDVAGGDGVVELRLELLHLELGAGAGRRWPRRRSGSTRSGMVRGAGPCETTTSTPVPVGTCWPTGLGVPPTDQARIEPAGSGLVVLLAGDVQAEAHAGQRGLGRRPGPAG